MKSTIKHLIIFIFWLKNILNLTFLLIFDLNAILIQKNIINFQTNLFPILNYTFFLILKTIKIILLNFLLNINFFSQYAFKKFQIMIIFN
jgi:hypothetical protein